MNSRICKGLGTAFLHTVAADFVLGGLVATIALLGAPAGWADPVTDCQEYSAITLNQVAIAIGKKNGGYGDGCRGAEGPRWSNDKAEHFTWCQEATPEDLAAELKARRDLLLKCTAKRGKKKWPMWDVESAGTYSGGFPTFWSPDEHGKFECEGAGNHILNAVKTVQNDRSILFDEAKDKSSYNSRYYHHFQHWTGIRCMLKMSTAHTKGYFLEGYTGVGVETEPRGGPVVAPGTGPIEETELEKGPITPNPDASAPPPDQPEQPYVTKRKTGPFTQD